MRLSLRVVAALVDALVLHAVAQPTPDAEGAPPDMPAARVPSTAELGVQTVEIPRASAKDIEDAPPTLTAYWVAPPVKALATGTPVVIALHGCSGLYTPAGADARALGSRHRGYAQWLGAHGYAVVFPDSFSPRGKSHGIYTERTTMRDINGAVRCADVLATIRWVTGQPGVDARHIVLLGWSNGAQAVLEAMDVSRAWPADTPAVNRAVAFYPGCASVQKRPDYRPSAPLLLLAGGNDDWTLADHCQALQIAVLAHQPQVRFELDMFGGAYHGFDDTVTVTERNGIPKRRCYGTITVGDDSAACEAAFTKFTARLDAPHPWSQLDKNTWLPEHLST